MRKMLRASLIASPILAAAVLVTASPASADPGTPGAHIVHIQTSSAGPGCKNYVIRWKDARGHVYDEHTSFCLGGKLL